MNPSLKRALKRADKFVLDNMKPEINVVQRICDAHIEAGTFEKLKNIDSSNTCYGNLVEGVK